MLTMGLLWEGNVWAQTNRPGRNENGPVLQSVQSDSWYAQRIDNYSGAKSVVSSGDTISYCGNNAYGGSIGVNDVTTNIFWGVHFPASALTGRNSVSNVQIYIPTNYGGTYTLDIYQGTSSAPQTLLYSQTYSFTSGLNNWMNCSMVPVGINNTQDLWIIFENADVTYPAAGCSYVNDNNSDYISLDGSSWDHAYGDYSLAYSWMIRCITSSSAAAPAVSIAGPTTIVTGNATTFTAVSTTSDPINWTLQGATPATATGSTVTATWSTPGTYDVIATAGTVADTLTVSVISCDAAITEYPYTMGFEGDEDMNCFVFVDADGDGYNWNVRTMDESYIHSGVSAIGSASWISEPLTPDNWMILPKMQFQTAGAYTLTWWQGIIDPSYYNEQYSVLVSTGGVNPTDFTLLQQYTIDDTNWVQKTIDLSSYAGQTIRIAFRHHGSTDVYWMLIDDIAVTETILETATINYQCGGTGEGNLFADAGYTTSLCGTTVTYPAGTSVTLYLFAANECNEVAQLLVNDVDQAGSLAYNYDHYEYTFTATDDATIRAVFDKIRYTVTATATTGGSVIGGDVYDCGSQAVLEAIADPGYHFVRWSDGNGNNPRTITVEDNVTLQALFEANSGIETAETASPVVLMPNPSTDYFDVVLSNMTGEVLIQVVDLNGRIVVEQTVADGSKGTLRVDTKAAGLSHGSYLVRVRNAEHVSVQKLVVK